MNALIETIYETRGVEDAAGNRRPCGDSPIHREVCRLLYDLIRHGGRRSTLEIGMAYGLSTLSICQSLRDNGGGRHTAIDPNQSSVYDSIGVLNVERAGLSEHFRLIEDRSYLALPQLCRDGEHFDLVFIDGSHIFDFILIDFFYADRMLEVGGLVAFDDLWMPAVRKIISYVLSNRSYELIRMPAPRYASTWHRAVVIGRRFLQDPLGRDVAVKLIPTNVCVVRKLAEDNRPWDFHRRF